MVLCFGFEHSGSRGVHFILNGICYQDFYYCGKKNIERKEGRQCKYNVTLRRFLATSVAVEKQ